MMVHDNATRLIDARNDLESTVKHFELDDGVRESEELVAARALLEEVRAGLET